MNEVTHLEKLQRLHKELTDAVKQMRREMDKIKREKDQQWVTLVWQFLVLNLLIWSVLMFGVKYQACVLRNDAKAYFGSAGKSETVIREGKR